MSSDASAQLAPQLWRAHPDDADEVADAMRAADSGELLSPAASEAFLRWLDGSGDESWRAELA